MKSPLAEELRDRLLAAMLPHVAFDGWTRAALRAGARAAGIPAAEALALFPGGAADFAAAFSRRADRLMLQRLAAEPVDNLPTAERVARAVVLRLETLEPWREAVRRAMVVLALPFNAPLGLRLLYETVDAIWYAVGDHATDFSFYTKRMSLAGVLAATVLYWLDDRSPDFVDTRAFLDRRLADLGMIGRLRADVARAARRLPDPLRLLRTPR
jgi:ubiquinone biosynthesis protein COQ9